MVDKLLTKKGEIEFIGDSGASATFTNNLDDFTEYTPFEAPSIARTANKGIPLEILGSGTIFLKHTINSAGDVVNVRLAPVFYIQGLSV